MGDGTRKNEDEGSGPSDEAMAADPIHQFQINKLFTIVKVGANEIAFTNSALFMAIAVAGIAFLMIGLTRRRALVPSRLQSLAEISYEFVGDTLRNATG